MPMFQIPEHKGYWICLRGNLQKKKSPFKDIIQIKVDHPPTYPILDKLFFDKF